MAAEGTLVFVAMALFSWLMIGLFVAFVGGIVLLGLYSPRSGADVLGWRPTRSPEAEGQNELDDIEQMLAASNALRRAPRRRRAHRGGRRRRGPRRAARAHRRAREYGEDG